MGHIPVYEMWICITVYIHRHHNVIVYIRDVCRYVYALVVHVYLTMDKMNYGLEAGHEQMNHG